MKTYTAHVRMAVVNPATLTQYFQLSKHTLVVACSIAHLNMDETGISLDSNSPNVVTVKGSKKVRYRLPGRKGQVTMVACGNAVGQVIPPMMQKISNIPGNTRYEVCAKR